MSKNGKLAISSILILICLLTSSTGTKLRYDELIKHFEGHKKFVDHTVIDKKTALIAYCAENCE